ncbi:MAG: hypothetical protein R3E12_10240 [Candidatus Eisenbacteria bacterium]
MVCPLLPRFGPVGEIVAGAGLLLLAASLPGGKLRRRLPTAVLALIFVTTSAAGVFRDLDLASHAEKRGARETRLRAEAEFRRWDPVSKIEVVDVTAHDSTGATVRGTRRKLISYDGGSQSSHIYPFDGDYRALRARLPEATIEHFWQRGVLAAHYLFRDRSPRTLVIGCAGGQEVKAALVYGARHVDAIDLVETVVELGSRQYADYNGGIFLDPRVHYFQAEARAYLAAGPEAYDIIQIFSYHNSARLASGGGAVKAYYLETAEALALFLSHLSDQGVLQINQAIYPRVLVTLGQAMQSVGWSDPARHVVVYARDGIEDHATILVSRKPWDAASLFPLDSLLLPVVPSEGRVYRRVIDPLDPGASFLPPALWAEGATARASSLRARAPYRLDPVTDDRPFAYFLRKKLGRIAQDSTRFVDRSIARLVNQPGSGGWLLPRDLAHLVIIALVGLGVVLAVLAAPRRKLRSSPAWPRAPVLGYFACLGIGFLVLELTLVQLGLVPIGVPIQAYATTLGTLLVGAGIGSLCSARFVTKEGWAFALLLAAGVFVALGHAGVWSAIQGNGAADSNRRGGPGLVSAGVRDGTAVSSGTASSPIRPGRCYRLGLCGQRGHHRPGRRDRRSRCALLWAARHAVDRIGLRRRVGIVLGLATAHTAVLTEDGNA